MRYNPSSPVVRAIRIAVMTSILVLVGHYIMFDLLIPSPDEILRSGVTDHDQFTQMVMRREYIFIGFLCLLAAIVCIAAFLQWRKQNRAETS